MNDHQYPEVPSKLSDLIELALKDADVISKDSRYHITMGNWHSLIGGQCWVCLAGCVMAQTLKADFKSALFPDAFPTEWQKALDALNFVRAGLTKSAFEVFYSDKVEFPQIPERNGCTLSDALDDSMWRERSVAVMNDLRSVGY